MRMITCCDVLSCSPLCLQLMKEGDKWQLFIPSELAYGDRKMGQHITPGAVLLFDIEILKVKSGGYVKEL